MQKSVWREGTVDPAAVINKEPAALARKIAQFAEQVVPNEGAIRGLGDQLLSRHAMLRGLKPVVSAEEIVESFFRCHVIDYLQRQFGVAASNMPRCLNSSHRATRRTCAVPAAHTHDSIQDSEWESGWLDLQRYPGVNIRTGLSERAKHADLYVVAQNKLISFEFKYAAQQGLGRIAECAAQVNRYIGAGHAASILVVYSRDHESHKAALVQLRGLLGEGVQLVCTTGPAIPVRRRGDG
jgi:hypothetical protein